MEFSKLLIALFTLQSLTVPSPFALGRDIRKPHFPVPANSTKPNVFRAYIGANFNNVAFSDVPISSAIEVHFILSFAVDYTTTSSPSSTNGNFNIFWDSNTLSPDQVLAIKKKHKNVKVSLSIGGDTIEKETVYFNPTSVDSWVSNAVSSLTKIIKDYNLDGIDIDYEHYQANPNTFAQCIGQLVSKLKGSGVISIASIAPYDDPDVQKHYQALWKSYGNQFDYVNFQFYAYDEGTTVSQFLDHFDEQIENYKGGNIIPSYATDGISGGLSPESGFFEACKTLKSKGKLAGIFVWSADDSKDAGFTYEKQSQALLASDGF